MPTSLSQILANDRPDLSYSEHIQAALNELRPQPDTEFALDLVAATVRIVAEVRANGSGLA